MRIRKIYLFILAITLPLLSGCSGFLDREPSRLLTEDQVYSDPNMVLSVLANFYGRVGWGPSITDDYNYIYEDEATPSSGGPDNFTDYSDSFRRVYDYGLIRNINQFLQGLRNSTVIDASLKKTAEGEARFLRAYTYFYMAKCMGGMPLVGDEVYGYSSGMDVTALQFPRSKESEIYDYVISELDAVAGMLTENTTTHSARVNKWAALALKARAALYAGSIAKYNNLKTPNIVLTGEEVGIPADKANYYYGIALKAAQDVMNSGKYKLQDSNPDKAKNFYNATSVKDNNTEVIWARDYKVPDLTHQFSARNIPPSLAEDIDRSIITPVLNIVEAFEYTDNRDGSIKTKDANGNYIFYDQPEDAFKNKDPRLAGSIIYPGGTFKGKRVDLQAGILYYKNGGWEKKIGKPGSYIEGTQDVLTSENGPTTSNEQYINKSGFFFKKFLDETSQSATRGRGSDMWFPYIRYAEVVMIACEASYELGQTGIALGYINQVRERAGIPDLTTITFNDIVRENQVEFAFEGHRWWDLKRWRIAHEVLNGRPLDPTAQQWALMPYHVVDATSPMNGKWVFEKISAPNSPYPRNFQMRNYYNFIDQDWINHNPKLVKNPYQ